MHKWYRLSIYVPLKNLCNIAFWDKKNLFGILLKIFSILFIMNNRRILYELYLEEVENPKLFKFKFCLQNLCMSER